MLGAHGGAGYTFAAAAASAASAAVMRERRWPAATTAASHGSRECQWQPRRPREATTLAPTNAEGTGSLVCHAKRSNTGSPATVPGKPRPTDCYHCCCRHRGTAAVAMRTTASCVTMSARPWSESAPSPTLSTAMVRKEGAALVRSLLPRLP